MLNLLQTIISYMKPSLHEPLGTYLHASIISRDENQFALSPQEIGNQSMHR